MLPTHTCVVAHLCLSCFKEHTQTGSSLPTSSSFWIYRHSSASAAASPARKDCILRMNGMSRLYDASLAKPWRMGKLLQNFWFLSLYAPLAILGTPHILNHHYDAFLGIVALGFELNRWIFTFQDMASSSHCPARAQFHYCPQPEHSDSTKGLLKYQPIMMASIHQCTSCLVITLPRIHTCLSSFCCQQ